MDISSYENQYNMFCQKVLGLPEGTSFRNVNEAVVDFLVHAEYVDEDELEDQCWTPQDLLDEPMQFWNNDLVIDTIQVAEGVVAISVTHDDLLESEVYNQELFVYVEEFLRKRGNNICPGCGHAIVGSGKFCANCGRAV